MKDEKDPTILKDFFSLVLLFSSTVTRAFPWPIKGKAGHPMKGIKFNPIQAGSTHRPIDPDPQQSNSQQPFILSTRDLDPFPLSLVCNPYYKLSVLVT